MATAKASAANPPTSRKLDAKEAVGIAIEFFIKLFPEEAKNNIRLEELEESEDGKYWLVTIGFDDPVRPALSTVFGPQARAYKSFRIDGRTGKVLSMKIRNVD